MASLLFLSLLSKLLAPEKPNRCRGRREKQIQGLNVPMPGGIHRTSRRIRSLDFGFSQAVLERGILNPEELMYTVNLTADNLTDRRVLDGDCRHS
jgi:hypothetical protein